MHLRKSSQKNNLHLATVVGALRASRVVRSLLSLAVLAALSISAIQTLRVQTVICTLDGQSCPNDLSSYTEHFTGKPMIGYDYAQLFKTTPYSLPLELTQVRKQLPNTLYLDFHIPPLAYQLISGDRKLSVTELGTVFENPQLVAPFSIKMLPSPTEFILADQTINPQFHHCILALENATQQSPLQHSKLTWVDKDTITLIMDGEQQTIFLDCAAIDTQVAKLSMLLSSTEYKEKRAAVKEIDMRFDLPVLRMQQ